MESQQINLTLDWRAFTEFTPLRISK